MSKLIDFTSIELLVVIAIIALLVAISEAGAGIEKTTRQCRFDEIAESSPGGIWNTNRNKQEDLEKCNIGLIRIKVFVFDVNLNSHQEWRTWTNYTLKFCRYIEYNINKQ